MINTILYKSHSMPILQKQCFECNNLLDCIFIYYEEHQQVQPKFHQEVKQAQVVLKEKCLNFLAEMQSSCQSLKIQLQISIDKSLDFLNQQIQSIFENDIIDNCAYQNLQSNNKDSSRNNFLNFQILHCQHVYQSLLNNFDCLLRDELILAIRQKVSKISYNFKSLLSSIINFQKDTQPQSHSQQVINYKLIEDYSIKQKEICCAMALNKDSTIMVVGCNLYIKVFEFNEGRTKQIQLLKNKHTNYIWTLNFMKQSNQFISGSYDNSIIIWSINQDNKYFFNQKLDLHVGNIYCLILNIYEDLIISGSDDKTIRFWKKKNDKWFCQQIITDHTDSVFGLSLNEQSNRLISCSYDKSILVMLKSQKESDWSVRQKIFVEAFGSRLCFINDRFFTFQPQNKEYFHVYELKDIDQQYSKVKDIPVRCGQDGSCLFPQQYIKAKSVFVNKNGQYVYILKLIEDANFITQQILEFESHQVFGLMSDDGEYLIIWNQNLQEIQIRQYNELGIQNIQ